MLPDALRTRRALEWIAVFEAVKGLAALAGLLGLLSLLHHDLHRLAADLIGHFGLDPHRHYPQMLLDAVDRINATPIRTVTLVACAYCATRWIEAWGLWHDKSWGEWFAAGSSALYMPLEIRHLLTHPHWPGVVVLLSNVALTAFLLWRLRQRLRGAPPVA